MVTAPNANHHLLRNSDIGSSLPPPLNIALEVELAEKS
jgi:hypothetical protein